MNHSNHTSAALSDEQLENVRGGGVSSHVANTSNAPQGGSGPAGTQNPTLGGMDTGVTVLKFVWGKILGI